jgi:hypothetical protein
VKTRDKWHKANWNEIATTPEAIHLTRESWLLDFDAEKDCYERYDEVVQELLTESARSGRTRVFASHE